ncbi:xylulokinase [Pontibacillus yanchengensis]|uniref:Xylulokinase n=2 Tax=Pontibacillus yanchengensis TaxID=462910 RepID=A0ACC7VD78_9BACI|nr:xylulokinase [Pontibacillus yanchengensis]MYL32157.1 xylulokinase [Pontibacillus yanchengensis]MYL52737.1 xylulokinase [Pontibacillus yanchengensis]
MCYVLGIDLGTSGVKVLAVRQDGKVVAEATREYPLLQPYPGYNEQNPEDWVQQTYLAIEEVIQKTGIDAAHIQGISYSGQMHGLVLLDDKGNVIRNAILWNDTRTSQECKNIEETLGEELYEIAKNPALEGFTLPKLLWVKNHEPDHYSRATTFLLPKDYLRYRMTCKLQMDFSDAAGTLLLDVVNKQWSLTICEALGISIDLCPELVESHHCVGNITEEVAKRCGLSSSTQVFAGGADNACGAIGAGVLSSGKTLCSIGTSGVMLSYEEHDERQYNGAVHYFNHGKQDAFYVMGVTLAAGYSLSWFKDTFAADATYESLLAQINKVPAGSNGLLFTPYIVGERTPHGDSTIRGSFIGMDASHTFNHFIRAVVEGVTFSLREALDILRESNHEINHIYSIGGGAKNDNWLQIQANIFDASIQKLENEHGPSLGAAILASYGVGWFPTLEDSVNMFVMYGETFYPQLDQVEQYERFYRSFKRIYSDTKAVNEEIKTYRDNCN